MNPKTAFGAHRRLPTALVAALAATALVASPVAAIAAEPEGQIRITEWMYNTSGDDPGEWVELTNVGDAPVDMTGWRYDDDSRNPAIGFDLSGFGSVAPGESVVLTEISPETFRTDWSLCGEAKVTGPYSNNLGRADEINIFDGAGLLVDRLTYGDQTVGGPRTNGVSGWVTPAALGANDATQWVRSTVGDSEGSWVAATGWIGSPTLSTLGGYDPCAEEPAEPGEIRISEWMYNTSGDDPGEWVELTNVGGAPVDLAGWRYDDDSRNPAIGFDLSGFGSVAPGESVVLTEISPETFRTDWALCGEAKVVGPYSNNLGRADEINIFDGDGVLVDRLTYGDQTVGGPRTNGVSGWATPAALGVNDATLWVRSTVGDAEGSWAATSGSIGSPTLSTLGGYDPCAEEPEEPAEPGEIRITEWMYNKADDTPGEWVELTNVGGAPVDLTGWRYDDDSRDPEVGFDLSEFGSVAAGESVVLTEISPAAFRTDWALCGEAKVTGPYSNNLGRADEINIFDGDGVLVDRLTYGDQTVGGPRTNGVSGWATPAALGVNDATLWVRSTVGDAEGSWVAASGSIGSPTKSTLGGYDPCEPGDGEAPTVSPDRTVVIGAVSDPTNPTLTLTLSDADGEAGDLVVSAASSNGSVLAVDGITVTGSGAERTVSFVPTARGTSTVTFTATDPDGGTGQATVSYAASAALPDPSGRYAHGISDASGALDVGDGHALLVNDETNTIFLYRTDVSAAPVKTWTFTSGQLGTTSEIDFESIARHGDQVVFTGSHGNNREGAPRPERRTLVTATIVGSGADTELTFEGRSNRLWSDLRMWDAAGTHGLGADALGFADATLPGVEPNAPDGFNIEAAEFSPDGNQLYLGLRAPTVAVGGVRHAVIVPVLNIDAVIADSNTAFAFGAPILADLGGRSIRAIASNDDGDYLISAGASPQNQTWALYTWNGSAAVAPQFNRLLPDANLLTGGPWEGIVTVPHPLVEGAVTRLVADSGDTNFYGTGQTKDLAAAYQKSYLQDFALAAVEDTDPGDVTVDRVAGANRYQVAVNISQGAYPGTAPVVYITNGENYPDALSAGPAAAFEGGPLLLVQPNSIPGVISAEIARLEPSKIVVVGGVNSVSETVFTQLDALADETVRIAGANRYEASRNIAEYAFGDADVPLAYIATGEKFPDALAAGGAAGSKDAPVILVQGSATNLDAATAALLDDFGTTDTRVLGGEASVTPGVFDDIDAITEAVRLGGANRYDAARAINSDAFTEADRAFLATGLNFPDALAGSAWAAALGAPLYVVPGTCVTAGVLADLDSLGVTHVTLLGGELSLTPEVFSLTAC